MIKKTGLVLTGALYAALAWGASGGGMPEGLPKFSEPLTLVLERLVNPQQEMLGGGGTHNSIQYSCSNTDEGRVEFADGFLDSSPVAALEEPINVHIANGKTKSGMRFSVGKGRFDLIHELGARHVTWREFERGNSKKIKEYKSISIEGLPDPAYGEHRVAFSIAHTAIVKCWSLNAGTGNAFKLTSPVQSRTVHTPPERSLHAPSCLCPLCVQLLQAVPSYPAPSCPAASPFRAAQPSFNSFQK